MRLLEGNAQRSIVAIAFAMAYGLIACSSSGSYKAPATTTPPVTNTAISWQSGKYGIPAAPMVSGIQFGFGVALGPNGGAYYASFNARSITRIGSSGTVKTVVSQLACGPSHLTLDGTGNIFFVEYQCGQIMEYSKQGVLSTLASGYLLPSGIAVASNGDVYFVTEGGGGNLYRIHDGVVSTLLTGLPSPEGMAIDSNGNLFFGLYGNPNAGGPPGAIMEDTAGNVTTLVGSGLWRVRDIALGPAGSVCFVEESNYMDQGNSGTLGCFTPGKGINTLLYDIDYPEGLAVTTEGAVYFTAERGHTTNAGTILFLYNPQELISLGAVAIGGTSNSPDAIIIAQGNVVSPSINSGTLTYTIDPALSISSEAFIILSRSLIAWSVDTSANLPMPGSWWPLPQINVTIDSQPVVATTYMARMHQGQRWPATIQNGIEIPAAGFSEQPIGFVVAFKLPPTTSPHAIRITFPASN